MKYPSYLNITRKEWQKKISLALKMLTNCIICPKKCMSKRLQDQKNGFCRLGRYAVISSFHPHFGEEKPLVGSRGSGTIFFAHCNLACKYCQNFDISQLDLGKEVNKKRLAEIMIKLQNLGCHNINFVTPSPNVPQILEALPFAIKMGLEIPLVYNTSSYDAIPSLKLLDGIVDIYMPDTKYSDDRISIKYSSAPNYFQVMKGVIKEMHHQVGDLVIENGIAKRGLLVRHLVLPNNLAGSEKIFSFLSNEISKNTFLNIMDQYYPYFKAEKYPEIARSIKRKEFEKVLTLAQKAGLKRLYL